MNRILSVSFFLFLFQSAFGQAIISSWQMNAGEFASYWENTNGNPTNPTFVFNTTTVLANVKKVCFNDQYLWLQSEGMTTNMGKYLNPGAPAAQGYTYRIPRNPSIPTTKTTSPVLGAIGMLINGVPIYGLSNARYYNGTNNNGGGPGGTWYVEVYKSEGFVLDTALGAHPQQQGAYHSHAKPQRLYISTATTAHSPIVGWSFDGHPVYGPNGYSNPLDNTSAIRRITSGFSLRNITTRTTLADGTVLAANKYGPAVSTTFPIGTYMQDYEWLASNGGDLDIYNGRFCKTPEFPDGVYAYFVTLDATGTPKYPYFIGEKYHGAPEADDITMGAVITIPTTNVTCFTSPLVTKTAESVFSIPLHAFPNPTTGTFNLSLPQLSGVSDVDVFSAKGELLYHTSSDLSTLPINLEEKLQPGVLMLVVMNKGKRYQTKIVIE